MDASFYLHSSSMRPALRVGLLVDSLVLPRWTADAIDHLLRCDFVAIVMVAIVTEGEGREGGGSTSRMLLDLYRRWDRRNVDEAVDPLRKIDLAGHLGGVETLQLEAQAGADGLRLSESSAVAIRNRGLDVLVRFGAITLPGHCPSMARHGVWSYAHGVGGEQSTCLPYFWEMVERQPFVEASLKVLAEAGRGERVLYRGRFATDEGFSLVRNGLQPYWGSSTFLIQKLRDLHLKAEVGIAAIMGESDSRECGLRGRSFPTNWEVAHWLLPLLFRKSLVRLVRRPVLRHWKMAIRVGARPMPAATGIRDMRGFRWIDSPRGRYYADPFIVEEAGEHWVFFEDVRYADQIGRISCARVVGSDIGRPVPVLELLGCSASIWMSRQRRSG